MPYRGLVVAISCLLPLAALAATLFFNMPVMPTVLVALLLLAPAGYLLLRWDGRGGPPDLQDGPRPHAGR